MALPPPAPHRSNQLFLLIKSQSQSLCKQSLVSVQLQVSRKPVVISRMPILCSWICCIAFVPGSHETKRVVHNKILCCDIVKIETGSAISRQVGAVHDSAYHCLRFLILSDFYFIFLCFQQFELSTVVSC